MLPKLVRSDYYNEDYLLNEQEYKEFNFTKIDPYWRLRALLYLFSLNPIGTKEELLRRVDKLLFDNYLYKRAGDEELRETSDIEVETIINNANTEFQHEFVEYFDKLNEEIVNAGEEAMTDDDIMVKFEFPWEVVKEITRQNRRFTYLEIHRGLTQFMRPSMCFYNHTLEGETLTAIVAFPYTPDMVFKMEKIQVFSLCAAANMLSSDEKTGNTQISITVLRQRMLDAIYAVQDAPRMHSVFPCQSKLKKCHVLASGFDPNYLCKLCCQEDNDRIASIINDTHDQFFREKLKLLSQFERQFDKKRTIRIQINKLVRRYELERMFEKYQIEWESTQVFHHLQTQRIEFVYLVCSSQEEAFKVIQNNGWMTMTLKRNAGVVTSIPNDLSEAHGLFGEPEKVIALAKPPSYLEVASEIPSGPSLFEQLKSVIKVITRLDYQEFTIEPDKDSITGEYDFRQFYVHLPTKSLADLVYDSQPYFGCIIAHKITHLNVFGYQRFARDVCMVSDEEKDPQSIWDMSKKTSAAQVDINMVDPCSTNEVFELTKQKKWNMQDLEEGVNVCIKTGVPIPEGSTLCEEYYRLQARKAYDQNFEQSMYWRELSNLKPKQFAEELMSKVSTMHLELREDLKNGRYHWFKPIYGTNIEQSMIKANKDLQEVMDNGHIIRGQAPKKYMREGKIFTFQGNQPMKRETKEGEVIVENIDHLGNPYIEYNYNPEDNEGGTEWEKAKINDVRSFSVEECNLHLSAENLKIRNSFHLMFTGLAKNNLTVKELYQEVYIKMQTLVGKVNMKDILVLDNQTLLADIVQSSKSEENSQEILKKLGRVACVKFENPLDAMCIITGMVKISLPLVSGTNGEPTMIPSKSFTKYLQELEKNSSVPYQNAGKIFSGMNKKIETVTNDIKDILMGGGGDKGNRKRRKRYRKKKKKPVGK